MSEEKITTCQICARPVKSKSGLIAHHGYKRPGGGWQTASCAGAKHLPYEISCDILPPTIEKIKNFISGEENQLKEFITNPPKELLNRWVKSKPTVIARPENFNPSKVTHLSGMPNTYENEFSNRIYDFDQNIRFAKIDLQFMEKRLADWTPR